MFHSTKQREKCACVKCPGYKLCSPFIDGGCSHWTLVKAKIIRSLSLSKVEGFLECRSMEQSPSVVISVSSFRSVWTNPNRNMHQILGTPGNALHATRVGRPQTKTSQAAHRVRERQCSVKQTSDPNIERCLKVNSHLQLIAYKCYWIDWNRKTGFCIYFTISESCAFNGKLVFNTRNRKAKLHCFFNWLRFLKICRCGKRWKIP